MMRSRMGEWWTEHPDQQERAERFLLKLVLDTGQEWAEAVQPWQIDAYASILGFPDAPCGGKHRVEVCGIVGAGKDQLAAAIVLAALHFGPEGVKIHVQSTDRDKSKDIVKSVNGFIRRKKAVGDCIQVVRDEVRCVCNGCGRQDCTGCSKGIGSRGGVALCESLDGPSTSGVIYDIALLNESQEWPEPHGRDVYTQISARRHKRRARLACLTNAPKTPRKEWRRERWERARTDGSNWHYIAVTSDMCPWISTEYLEEQRQELPTLLYNRWFKLLPSDGQGGLLTTEEVDRCVMPTLVEASAPDVYAKRFLGIDAGIKVDHYTLSLLRVETSGVIVLEQQRTWVPSQQAKGEVMIDEVEAVVMEYGKKWHATCVFDPWQAVQMRQHCEAAGIKCEVFNATAANLTEMAHSSIEAFRHNRVRLYPNAGFVRIDEATTTTLVQQLVAAEVKEMAQGIRVVHQRTKAGHGDAASSFLMALTHAMRAGVVTIPACVGSASGAAKKDGRVSGAERVRRMTRKHRGRYTGSRPTRRRRICVS